MIHNLYPIYGDMTCTIWHDNGREQYFCDYTKSNHVHV